MWVIDNENGKSYIRPAFIGFIKNNFIRKFLMVFYIIPTLIVTIIFNLIISVGLFIINVLSSFLKPTRSLIFTPVWKSEYWNKPRTK